MPSGGGQGASSNFPGAPASVYTPTQQPSADFNFWQALQPMLNTGVSGANTVGGVGSPSANAYMQSLSPTSAYITNNPAAQTGQIAAQNAYNFDVGQLFPQAQAGSAGLYGAATGGLPYGQNILNNAFSPVWGQQTAAAQNNPFANMAVGGGLQGAQLGQQGANQLQGAGQSLLQTGFDPQSALFNRSQQQLMDQTNAINAMSGIGGSPYGASVAANAMGNFDINWQNQQLARQAQAAGAASPLFQAAPGLAALSAGLPSGAYGNQLNMVNQALGNQNNAGIAGAGGFGNLLSGLSGGFSGANQLGQTGAAALGTFGAAPFQAGAQVGTTDLSALGTQAGLGNQAFQLPQQAINDLESYLGLGQSASQLSGALGQQGFNQFAQGLGGGLSGLNSLFGSNSLFGGSSGLFGAGGMFGGGAGGGGFLGGLGDMFGAGGAAGGSGAGLANSLATDAFFLPLAA